MHQAPIQGHKASIITAYCTVLDPFKCGVFRKRSSFKSWRDGFDMFKQTWLNEDMDEIEAQRFKKTYDQIFGESKVNTSPGAINYSKPVAYPGSGQLMQYKEPRPNGYIKKKVK